MLLLSCSASSVFAEERFYQVMDANGRIQTIREPVRSDEKSKQNDKAVVDSATMSSSQSQKQSAASPDAAVVEPSNAPYAAYDSDEYLDSGALDASHSKNNKKHFYIVNDGAGQRIENMDGEAEEGRPTSAAIGADAEYVELRDNYMVLPNASALDVAAGCLSEQQLGEAVVLSAGRLADVVFDKQLMSFVTPGQLMRTYHIDGQGLRTVLLRSYAKTDDDAAFVMPLVAFADAKGCILRVTNGYFQRYYPATKSKHSMLEANLVLHSDDVYIMIIMPMKHDEKSGIRPEYRISSLGRVSIKWQP